MAVDARDGEWFWDPAAGPGAITRAGAFLTIANTDALGNDQTPILEGLAAGDLIHVDEVDDPGGWWAYTVAEAPVPGGGASPTAAAHLTVDNYSGGFVRVRPAPDDPTTVDFALATVPGPGGAVFPALAAIGDTAAVWADFGGNLGKVKRGNGSDVTGATLKDWITRRAVFNVTRDDDTDPAHPALIVGTEVPAPPPADTTAVRITAGGSGTVPAPTDGDRMRVTLILMTAPPAAPAPHTFPVADPNELARRLGIGTPTPAVGQLLIACLNRAGLLIQPHCTDPALIANDSALYLEAVYQLAVKDWDLGTRGAVGGDIVGDYIVPGPTATAGLVRSVWAYIAPLNATGGLTV